MWLLLTDENLYLMDGDKYVRKLTAEVSPIDGSIKVVGIPQEWFSEPRDLIVDLVRNEPDRLFVQ